MSPEIDRREKPAVWEVCVKCREWLVSNFPEDNPFRLAEIKYFDQAAFYAQRLNRGQDPEVPTAVFLHAVGRALPLPFKPSYTPRECFEFYTQLRQEEYPASTVVNFLRENGASNSFISRVINLVRTREDHGGQTSQVKDGLRISFLKVLAPLFVLWTPEPLHPKKVEEQIQSMYYRIHFPEAKRMAEVPHLKAIDSLAPRLDGARREALRRYYRLVKDRHFSGWAPSEEEIEVLRKARDEVLSFR